MPDDSNRYRRRSVRLPGYDYAAAGAYFVTIVAHARQCLFGAIAADRVHLNAAGELIAACWRDIPRHFPRATLDEWVIMPNHLHGIVFLDVPAAVATPQSPGSRPLRAAPRGTAAQSLGAIVQNFKSVSARVFNRRRVPAIPLWQRNYFEHVIRSDADLARIRRYITDNPLQWALDAENPARPPTP